MPTAGQPHLPAPGDRDRTGLLYRDVPGLVPLGGPVLASVPGSPGCPCTGPASRPGARSPLRRDPRPASPPRATGPVQQARQPGIQDRGAVTGGVSKAWSSPDRAIPLAGARSILPTAARATSSTRPFSPSPRPQHLRRGLRHAPCHRQARCSVPAQAGLSSQLRGPRSGCPCAGRASPASPGGVIVTGPACVTFVVCSPSARAGTITIPIGPAACWTAPRNRNLTGEPHPCWTDCSDRRYP
jgi:hypothetical protein